MGVTGKTLHRDVSLFLPKRPSIIYALRRCAAQGIDIKVRFSPPDVLRRIAAQSICIKSRFPRDGAHCGSGVRRAIPASKNSAADSFAVDRVPFPQIYALIPFRIRLSGGGKHP